MQECVACDGSGADCAPTNPEDGEAIECWVCRGFGVVETEGGSEDYEQHES